MRKFIVGRILHALYLYPIAAFANKSFSISQWSNETQTMLFGLGILIIFKEVLSLAFREVKKKSNNLDNEIQEMFVKRNQV